jgi:hypothetical protein
MADYDEKEKKLKESVFFVEANSYESLSLWREFKEQYGEQNWVQDNMGFSQTIGFLNGDRDKPVVVSFFFNSLFGQRVCFYEATSRYVDHTMVEDYIKAIYQKKYDNDTRNAMTDAMNFHHAVHHCKELQDNCKFQT